uniref:Uncharacterized protein n=1 Tax=Ditylenchus dipsaci TaxID=166011 RepID=A0A915DIJ6_9BILA
MDFKFILSNVAGPGIEQEELTEDLEGCSCEDQCTLEAGCSCLKFANANNYDETGCFLHSSDVTLPFFECHSDCLCMQRRRPCRNRIIQLGIRLHVELVLSRDKGFGMVAKQQIKAGQFVVEYVGEVISKEEAIRRATTISSEEHNYILAINEHIQGELRPTFIDARLKSNMGRFVNHSCQPNLFPQVFRIGNVVPKLALFALRDISFGEELCYSYASSSLREPTAKEIEGSKHVDCFDGMRICNYFFLFLAQVVISIAQNRNSAGADVVDITPVPMEKLNPRLTEYRRIDSNADDQLSFSEFLLGDRPYIEAQSRRFHQLDGNSNGKVSREEFENFYKEQDDDHRHRRLHHDNFFKQLGTDLYNDPLTENTHHQMPSSLFNFPQGPQFDVESQLPQQSGSSPQQQHQNSSRRSLPQNNGF